MNLEQQVCSLELAKQLKELGITVPSYYIWNDGINDPLRTYESVDANCIAHYPAYTVAELGLMLPEGVFTLRIKCSQETSWQGWLDIMGDIHFYDECKADTETNCRAKMLIYLIEKENLTIEEINHVS